MIQISRAPLVLASDKCSNDEVREESRGIDLAQVFMHKQSQSQRKMIYSIDSNSNDSLDNVNRAKLLNGANVATLPDVQWMKSLL